MQTKNLDRKRRQTVIYALLLLSSMLWTTNSYADERSDERISLNGAVILVDKEEPSYVQYGARDLTTYLTSIGGSPASLSNLPDSSKKARLAIVIGQKMAEASGLDLGLESSLGGEGAVIRSVNLKGIRTIAVAGLAPQGTNAGIATLMQLIHPVGRTPFIQGPLDLHTKPHFAVRGFHLNAGRLNYPYGFRLWNEHDWKRFVDIAWAERVNLIYLWPFMEIMPVPLSAEDEGYLREVYRVIDYAQQQRGIRVWIMHAANRIGISDCGIRDPRQRMYWVTGCQEDLNPSDSQQFKRILTSLETLYKSLNNADGFCIIDSDPGGWPQSPLHEQIKIFRYARQTLDRYNTHGKQAVLADWMWVGWGRRFVGPTEGLAAGYDWTKDDPGESDVAFMTETIRAFKRDLTEPWELVAGFEPYLGPAREESVLGKTIYLPYAVVENDVFPATNLDFRSIRRVLDQALQTPGLKGMMGNNQMVLLQFPSTYYFFSSAWDIEYKNKTEKETLQDVSESLYPEYKDLMADSFLALREGRTSQINQSLSRLQTLINGGNPGNPGFLGRFLFPDRLVVARTLYAQLKIRRARENLIDAMQGKPDINHSRQLVQDYFDNLLAWNEETGWDKLMDEGSATPLYDPALFRECGCPDKELARVMSRLKQTVLQPGSKNSYAQISAFFDPISNALMKKYGENSVMIGCVEPFKLAVIQAP